MIELKQLNKTYQTSAGPLSALTDINLQVPAGQIFGVIGKSGAGKSTLIRCVNLLEKPSAGKVVIAGQDLLELSAAELSLARHQIGMIFQHFNLLNSRTVYSNVALPLILTGHKQQEIQAIVQPLLELTGLTDKARHYPDQLSGGQKQRVAIARALVYKPKVLLCDEATSALDPETTAAILDLLDQINQQLGLTILLITHEMDVIKQICHQVALIDQGKIIEQNNLIDFFTKPNTDLAKSFVSGALKHSLPTTVANLLKTNTHHHSQPVVRVIFQSGSATQPLITELVRRFSLSVNILQANIEYLQHTPIGIMVFAVSDNIQQLDQAMSYLHTQGVKAEIIGYVD